MFGRLGLTVKLLRHCRFLALGALPLILPAFAGMEEGLQAYQEGDYQTAFHQLQPLAETGGPHLQDLLGVMHRFGLGTPEDVDAAHAMFDRAARQPRVPQPAYQRRHGAGRFLDRGRGASHAPRAYQQPRRSLAADAQRLEQGRQVFLVYCAGCHGFNGFAAYPPAPSFSMQERMHKSDLTLLQTILKGRNAMPSWESKLPRDQLEAALGYIRYMAMLERAGGPRPLNSPPPYFYKFWPDEM